MTFAFAAHSLYWLQHGAAKTYKTDKAGNECILELGQDGDFMGYADLLATTDYTASAMLLEGCTVGVMPRQEFFALLAQHPDVARHFLQLLGQTRAAREQRVRRRCDASSTSTSQPRPP